MDLFLKYFGPRDHRRVARRENKIGRWVLWLLQVNNFDTKSFNSFVLWWLLKEIWVLSKPCHLYFGKKLQFRITKKHLLELNELLSAFVGIEGSIWIALDWIGIAIIIKNRNNSCRVSITKSRVSTICRVSMMDWIIAPHI